MEKLIDPFYERRHTLNLNFVPYLAFWKHKVRYQHPAGAGECVRDTV